MGRHQESAWVLKPPIRPRNHPFQGNKFLSQQSACFGIDKTQELVGKKYYWPTLGCNVETYVWGCNVCLTSKAIRHKPYGNLQLLLVPSHYWKDFSMNLVTRLPVSTNWKGESYNSILVIVDQLTKMMYYKPVKITIDAPRLAEVILDAVVWYHGFSNSIMSDRD